MPEKTLDDCLGEFIPPTAELANTVLTYVRRLCPGALERVYDAYNALAIGFATGDSLRETFIHVAVYPHHVNIGFNRGAEVPDPKKLLLGSGSTIRHVKVNDEDRLRDPAIAALVKASAAQAGFQGKKGKKGEIKMVSIYANRRPRR